MILKVEQRTIAIFLRMQIVNRYIQKAFKITNHKGSIKARQWLPFHICQDGYYGEVKR